MQLSGLNFLVMSGRTNIAEGNIISFSVASLWTISKTGLGKTCFSAEEKGGGERVLEIGYSLMGAPAGLGYDDDDAFSSDLLSF